VDEVEERDVRVSVLLGVRNNKPQVRLDKLTDRLLVALLDSSSELELLLVIQRRVARDVLKITAKGSRF